MWTSFYVAPSDLSNLILTIDAPSTRIFDQKIISHYLFGLRPREIHLHKF